MKVVAINAPFILCEEAVTENASVVKPPLHVDCRHTRWTKLTEEFIREYCRLKKVAVPGELKSEEDKEEDKNDKKRCCPLCVEPMTERKGTKSGWKMICKSCDVQLTRIEK